MMDEYGGHWIETFSGKKFHFLDPQPEEILIEDIAHALSLTCRFAGNCRVFYSVAEHSIRVAEIVPNKYKLHALLHDASEAYLPDLPRPIKAEIPMFKILEDKVLSAIYGNFLPPEWWLDKEKRIIKEADNILLATEARDLMDNTNDWALLPPALLDEIMPMTSGQAEELFLIQFREYCC